jgi:putative PIN family toxin of toxin-antitoxin system
LLGGGTAGEIVAAFGAGEFVLVLSSNLFDEIGDAVKRPKMRAAIGTTEAEELLGLIEERGAIVVPSSEINICRDAKDNWLLEAAVEGEADMIVTGDHDLLVLGRLGDTEIVRPVEFLRRLGATGRTSS